MLRELLLPLKALRCRRAAQGTPCSAARLDEQLVDSRDACTRTAAAGRCCCWPTRAGPRALLACCLAAGAFAVKAFMFITNERDNVPACRIERGLYRAGREALNRFFSIWLTMPWTLPASRYNNPLHHSHMMS